MDKFFHTAKNHGFKRRVRFIHELHEIRINKENKAVKPGTRAAFFKFQHSLIFWPMLLLVAMAFDYSLDFEKTDFRKNPEFYRVGKGEKGVLLVEPYKSEILPHWKFKTPEIARDSAKKIYELFLEYKAADDFAGMDMARKFLQMGFTRARRYANHKSGRKYADKESKEAKKVLPREEDPVKAESAKIFYDKYLKAKNDKDYLSAKKQHQEEHEKT